MQNPPAEIHVTVDTPPTSTITSPTAGATVLTDHVVNITGTASDAGSGTVARVEVSVDGGATWNVATGTTAWSYNWTPTLSGNADIKSRAIDNRGIVQDPPAAVRVTVLDTKPPMSIITSPSTGGIVSTGTTVSVTGTASDAGGGAIANVEVSVNGGATWKVATGTTVWSYNWTPTTPGPATIKSRAVDDSGNQQNPPAEIAVTVRLPIRVASEQPTIRSAIDVATDGDTVLVATGTYVENINFGGKAITVTSEGGPEVTIIDGGNDFAPVVRFISGEGRGSVLNGFTLQNGRVGVNSPVEGGGIAIQNSSPTITNNVIRNNQACSGGGIGIDSFGSPSGSSPLIQRNTITSNISPCAIGGGGGGIFIIWKGSPEILDNVISDNINPTGGGVCLGGGGTTPIIKRNVIKGNDASRGQGGGGIWMNDVEGSDRPESHHWQQGQCRRRYPLDSDRQRHRQ